MLNRRILRIKAFKTLYSFAENPSMDLKEVRKQLEVSCEATRDLYLLMMALIPALTSEALSRIESARNKFNPTDKERFPNMKFASNGLAAALNADTEFQKLLSRKKLSWEQYDVFLRQLYETVRERDYFLKYMENPGNSLKEDAALFTRIFEADLVDDASLEAILEDLSIYWNDDLAYALTCCCRSLDQMCRTGRWTYPELYLSDMNGASGSKMSDSQFVHGLLEKAVTGYERYYQMVSECVPQWDKDRLFTTDVCLIALGLAEQERFGSEIDPRITINEYVEITKFYSTRKSSSFVNSLLDKLIKEKLNKN